MAGFSLSFLAAFADFEVLKRLIPSPDSFSTKKKIISKNLRASIAYIFNAKIDYLPETSVFLFLFLTDTATGSSSSASGIAISTKLESSISFFLV